MLDDKLEHPMVKWENIVGEGTVQNGGYVGDLLTIARAHVDAALRNNELTANEAGKVFTAMIPAAFQNAIDFELKEDISIRNIIKLDHENRILSNKT